MARVSVPVSAVEHVAVIEALHLPCDARHNKLRMTAADVVGVIDRSPIVRRANRRKVQVVVVNAVKLRQLKRNTRRRRKRWSRPGQLEFEFADPMRLRWAHDAWLRSREKQMDLIPDESDLDFDP